MGKQPDPWIFAVVPFSLFENERYLQAVAEHLWSFCDTVSFFPDPKGDMMKHEGNWRSLMLDFTHDCYWEHARSGIDWILVNDADEFVVSTFSGDLRTKLINTLRVANMAEVDSLTFGLDELWQLDPPKVRTDKYWKGQTSQRMFRYRAGMPNVFPPKSLASGSIPTWARHHSGHVEADYRVLHAGYAHAPERQMKFDRYNGRPEHGSAHVQSIMDDDVRLEDLTYECPEIWRGSTRERSVQGG